VEKRRRTVRQPVRALILLAAFGGTAQACELPPGTRVESPRAALSYRTIPVKIAVGEPFVLELATCPKTQAALSGRVKLDAHMPEHRHGMNYRPSLKPIGGGRYFSEGWLFHMPGRWEFVFDLDGERLTHSVRIE
jgi:hypothetical protein